MNKISLMLSLATLTLIGGGCSMFSGSESSTEAPTEQATTPPTTPDATKESTPKPKDQDFKGAIEPGKKPPSQVASGLIPPTNPDKRYKDVIQGRNDPFGLIPIQPIVTVDQEKAAKIREETVPKIPVVPSPPPSGINRQVNQNTKPKTVIKIPSPPMVPSQTLGGSNILPNRTFSPELPTIPDPDLAKQVAVTGVMEIGGVIHVILQAPNEASSRSVRPGQYISNGQILVKRVEMNRGAVPIVILEQFGIEVSKEVGEEPETAETNGGTTATLPNQEQRVVPVLQTVPTASVPTVVLIPPKQNS